MLFRVVYSSKETRPMAKEDLSNIITTATKNNQRDDITGCLLYQKPYFAQVLEGNSDQLTKLLNRLKCDTRHKNLQISSLISIKNRTFGDWYMTLASKDPLSTEFLRINLGLETFDPSKINDEDLFALIKRVKCG